jgi:hypothetical protein
MANPWRTAADWRKSVGEQHGEQTPIPPGQVRHLGDGYLPSMLLAVKELNKSAPLAELFCNIPEPHVPVLTGPAGQ